MKHKALSALIAVAMIGGGISAAHAQDGSWYVAPRIGVGLPRQQSWNRFFALHRPWHRLVGVAEFRRRRRVGAQRCGFQEQFDSVTGREWESVSLGVTGRWFFGDQGSAWRPYVLGGLGALRHAAYSGTVQEARLGSDGHGRWRYPVQLQRAHRPARQSLPRVMTTTTTACAGSSTTSASRPGTTTTTSTASPRSA